MQAGRPRSRVWCACAQDPLADLFGAPAQPAAAAAPAPAAFPPITAFERDGVKAELAFQKPPGAPAQTAVTATYTNAGAAPVTGFTLQVCFAAGMHARVLSLIVEPTLHVSCS